MIKKLRQILFHRVILIVLFMLVQLGLIIGMVWRFNSYFVYFYSFSTLFSALVVLEVINGRRNPAYKISWIIPILILPVFGTLIYLMFGRQNLRPAEVKKMREMRDRIPRALPDNGVLDEIAADVAAAGNQSRYIRDYSYIPPCKATSTEYLSLGEIAFERMKAEFEKAERYIFLEYFIVREGVMWDTLLEILARKAGQGVDVRLIYDDLGCMFTLPYRYDRKLEAMGIQCSIFSPFRPELSSRFNNRSHRKLAVVDGRTAFTGGINLADEYINAYEKHGHWKDTAILIQGDAAWSMTVMFLSMWDYVTGIEEDFAPFRPEPFPLPESAAGYVQPYFDTPLDGEPVGENIYMNLINKAERYVYITTPYLIIDNEMATALTNAAKSGVDVRIITPHIADKWYVHAVTRHNYEGLIESGVRIYEYTPGFIHAKSFVVDGVYGVVGTVNLDFRSLYLHFECGVWLYRTESIAQVLADFNDTLPLCQEITLEDCRAVPFPVKLGRAALSVFAPLM